MAELNIDNIQKQMRKGILEFCVLLILKDSPAYAADLLAKLKNANLIVVEGTLYPLLTRMKTAGLLYYNWVESMSGPPRKYYTLSPEGEVALDELARVYDNITAAIDCLKA